MTVCCVCNREAEYWISGNMAVCGEHYQSYESWVRDGREEEK